MDEYQQRRNRDQNQSSDDRELTSESISHDRLTPQYSDASSQFSIEEILEEENKLFFNSERVSWKSPEDEFEESHDSAFERLVMEQRKEENEIFFNSGGDSQYDDVSLAHQTQERVASASNAGWGELGNRENLTEEQIEAENEIAQEVLAGALQGDFNNDPTFWSDIGQIVTGLIPIAGQLGDARDLIHILDDITNKEGYKKIASWAGLVLIVIGFVPGEGDAIKSIGKRGLRYLDNNRILKRIGQFLGDNIISPILERVGDITAPLVNQIKDAIRRKLAEAQEIARQLGEGVDNVIDDVTNRPQLATEGVGNVNLSQVDNTNQPMRSQGSSSSSSAPISLKGLSNAEVKRLSDIATAKGLKSGSVTNLYNNLGEKAVKNLLKESDDEIAAAMRAIELERLDGGHSVARHGPQVEDAQLETRLKTGIAPDGRVSFAPASTKFNSFENWVKTRDLAWKKIEQLEGIDLSKPPKPNMNTKYDITMKYDKPIDDGFVPDKSTASKVKVIDPVTGKKKKGNVYSSLDNIDGVTGTFTRVSWDRKNNKWVVVQHYPYAEGWDNATKSYSSNASIDAKVNLP